MLHLPIEQSETLRHTVSTAIKKPSGSANAANSEHYQMDSLLVSCSYFQLVSSHLNMIFFSVWFF